MDLQQIVYYKFYNFFNYAQPKQNFYIVVQKPKDAAVYLQFVYNLCIFVGQST